MAETLDETDIGYDFDSPKTLVTVKRRIISYSEITGFHYGGSRVVPMDVEALYGYYTPTGGITPIDSITTSAFSSDIDYGASGFEGVRLTRTPFGNVFIQLPWNLRRLAYTSLALDLSLVDGAIKLIEEKEAVCIEHLQRTPAEFFADASNDLEQDISMGVDLVFSDGHKIRKRIPFKLTARFPDTGDRFVSPKEFQAAMCIVGILNNLARGGSYLPDSTHLIPGGYFRPGFSYTGDEGLKVPTAYKSGDKIIFRPKSLKIGTLPWGPYLDESGYGTGLDVLFAPYPRVDGAMPVWQKVGGVYVNSARNINIAMILGFGEILACNHEAHVVEGSAENLIFFMTNKRTGAIRAYIPPLSSNILAGTTRARINEILERGLYLADKKVELIYEAPKKKDLIKHLEGRNAWELSAIVLMGTGVGLIHVRSITDMPQLRDWLALNELRSEECLADPLVLTSLHENKKEYPVNPDPITKQGKKHPIVDALKLAHTEYALADNGARLTPIYAFDYERAEKIFGVQIGEVLNKAAASDFRSRARGGYFEERINGITHPDELRSRTIEAVRLIKRMNTLSQERRRIKVAAHA